MTDNAKKAKIRFSLVDLFIIIAVIAVATGIVMRFNLIDRIGLKSNSDTVIISFLIQDIKESSSDALVIGEMFYIESNGTQFGELISKKPQYAEAFIENSDGRLVKTQNENSYDVRGEFRATGRLTDKGFMLGGTQAITPGKRIYLESMNIMVTVMITSITPAAQT